MPRYSALYRFASARGRRAPDGPVARSVLGVLGPPGRAGVGASRLERRSRARVARSFASPLADGVSTFARPGPRSPVPQARSRTFHRSQQACRKTGRTARARANLAPEVQRSQRSAQCPRSAVMYRAWGHAPCTGLTTVELCPCDARCGDASMRRDDPPRPRPLLSLSTGSLYTALYTGTRKSSASASRKQPKLYSRSPCWVSTLSETMHTRARERFASRR